MNRLPQQQFLFIIFYNFKMECNVHHPMFSLICGRFCNKNRITLNENFIILLKSIKRGKWQAIETIHLFLWYWIWNKGKTKTFALDRLDNSFYWLSSLINNSINVQVPSPPSSSPLCWLICVCVLCHFKYCTVSCAKNKPYWGKISISIDI